MDAALIILDGWGRADHDRLDAVRAASTPNFDRFWEAGASGTLTAWGPSVGLPEGGMGNSEVGHLTIGAGHVVKQARTQINEAIEDGSFFDNEALVAAFDAASDGRVHFAGLVSDAGVHADDAHLHALIEMAAARDADTVTHAFTDGRDTPPTAAREYISALERVIDTNGTGRVATVSGRYYAMDRDEHWDRTHQVYNAIVNREAPERAATALEAVEGAYERGETDEFIRPTVIEGGPPVETGDAVIAFNFRADRMRQLLRMLAEVRSDWPFETRPPDVPIVTMTEYDERFDFPVAFPPNEPAITLGAVLADHGKTQFRIAETEKYPHVTYFLNGGRELEYPGEIREIVPSPDVPTYDQEPEMSAAAVTDRAIEVIAENDPDVLVLNYANPDMVGHTGNFEAAVEAVEAVDTQLGRLINTLFEHDAHVLVVADHGNADDMGRPGDPHTAHTYNPVPVIYITPDETSHGKRIRASGTLADIAPTLLDMVDLKRPPEMIGRSLLE